MTCQHGSFVSKVHLLTVKVFKAIRERRASTRIAQGCHCTHPQHRIFELSWAPVRPSCSRFIIAHLGSNPSLFASHGYGLLQRKEVDYRGRLISDYVNMLLFLVCLHAQLVGTPRIHRTSSLCLAIQSSQGLHDLPVVRPQKRRCLPLFEASIYNIYTLMISACKNFNDI
jgi:hypothetical protein